MAVDPMRAAGVSVLVERAYRESGQYQWVREAYKNAEEAGASRVDFTVEWTGVASRNIYRRLIADNGAGMAPDLLERFINVFGGSGKPIGGEHENYGIGCKTSLLPWNRAGVCIVSWHDGEPAMIRLRQDPETGEYGLHVFSADDNGTVINETVVEPFDDRDGETGVDWTAVTPDWIREQGHGTVLVLLGNALTDDTVLGAPGRKEDATKGVLSYLNTRLWTVPTGLEIYADVFSSSRKPLWPRDDSPSDALTHRRVYGSKHYVEWTTRGGVEASSTEELPNGVMGNWWLRDGTDLSLDYAPDQGFVAVLYRNELFDVSSHASTFRSFGIVTASVRRRLYVVLQPPLAGADGVDGVYPNTSRNGLLMRDASGERAGERVPVGEWGEQFADAMPAAVRAAVAAAMTGASDRGEVDESLRQKIAARFASRWRVTRLKVASPGSASVTPTELGSARSTGPRPAKRHGGGGGRGGRGGLGGKPVIGTLSGPFAAARSQVRGDLPHWQLGTAADVGEEWVLATFAERGGARGEPVVIINAEHPVMRGQIEYYQQQFAPQYAERIGNEVANTYGLVAATKVAHAESLRALATPQQIVEMRSDAALTTALLGLYAEDKVLAPRLTGIFGRARKAV